MKRILLLALATGAAFAAAPTQSKQTLTADGAERIAGAAMAMAKKLATTGAVAVVDDGGNLMALKRADGTFAAAANISIGKARTAAQFQRATHNFEDIIAKGRTAMVALNDFTPLQGGIPLLVDGQIVGAVGVSGAASAAQDEELAQAAVAALNQAEPQVSYFEASQVNAAFDKGAVLFDMGERYMVHASRREAPGMAEIHLDDADIVHVLDGTATLVTGGRALDVKTIAAAELRGTAIEGGETRQLHKGDVVIIPAGVPHWFREVSKPFLYYVVKVR